MKVAHLEVLVEEPSTETALRILLPKMLNNTSFEIYHHSCKQELLKHLPVRLRGYVSWIPDDWRIIVLVDRDDDNCQDLKKRLEAMAAKVGLATKSNPKNQHFAVANRLAIKELEAWYFGDWEAVRQAYPKVNANLPSNSKYRSPDAIRGGTWEAFERVMKAAGYFKTGLRKIEAARKVANHMDPNRNTSPSFQVLRETLAEISTEKTSAISILIGSRVFRFKDMRRLLHSVVLFFNPLRVKVTTSPAKRSSDFLDLNR